MDIDTLAAAWRSRAARQRTERRARAERARADAHRAAGVLRSEFGVDEVWLFGSLASEPRHDAFDIDLAVRGLRPDRYFTALARIGDIVNEPFDVVTLETCGERILQAVEQTGVRIDGG
jgi:predicted nucleotidyltransferase